MTLNVCCFIVLASTLVLWKSADWFVEGAVGVAEKLRLPHMLVGLVLVSLATTAPELTVSLVAALQDAPEIALGNAVGSVIVDDSVALGLAAILAPAPLVADRRLFKTIAVFLPAISFLAFFMVRDGALDRIEGLVLLGTFVGYLVVCYRRERRSRLDGRVAATSELDIIDEKLQAISWSKVATLFVAGLIGLVVGSELLVTGAKGIATFLHMPSVVVGLTVVAVGTSVPEIVTAVAAARKGHAGIALGNILGADILNICWVAGLSAIANPLRAEKNVIMVMFPAMITIVLATLFMIRTDHRLSRREGCVLLLFYVLYVAILLYVVPPGSLPRVATDGNSVHM
jgi:cation:H+ antiporter